MKLRELKEMAIKGGNFRPLANDFADSYKKFYKEHKHEFKHIGDVEIYQCFQYQSVIFLFDSNEIIFICSIEDSNIEKGAKKIDSVWLDYAYEGKKIYSKVLWFLRSREGIKKLIFGDHHSEDTYKILAKGGLSGFDKTWVNSETGEREKFSTETIDKYYNDASGTWKLMLESNKKGNKIAEQVKEFRYSYVTDLSLGYVTAVYDWQIE
jgi:hypothetical protein